MPRLLRRLQPHHDPAETEATLVAKAQCDPQAFADVYNRYFEPIYRYCYHRLGDREAAEDATSQVFLQVYVALPRYQEAGTFRSGFSPLRTIRSSTAGASDDQTRPWTPRASIAILHPSRRISPWPPMSIGNSLLQ